MYNKLKVGDKLVCTQESDYLNSSIEVGRLYNVIYTFYMDKCGLFRIMNDCGHEEVFTVNTYRKYFIKLSDLRKQKLKKLGCTSLINTEV